MSKVLVLICLVYLTFQARATSTITGISGATGFTANTSSTGTGTTPTPTPAAGATPAPAAATTSASAFGGIAGALCPNMNGSSICNSCDPTVTTSCKNAGGTEFASDNGAFLCACNQNRLYDTQLITVYMLNATPLGGLVHASSSSGGTVGTELSAAGGTYIPASQQVTFTWQQVCSLMTSASGTGTASTCENITSGSSVQIEIWVDNDNSGSYTTGDDLIPVTFKIFNPSTASTGTTTTSEENVYAQSATEGVGSFVAFPGDTRIYIDQANTPNTFPALGAEGGQAVSAMILVSSQNMDNATVPGTAGGKGLVGNMTVSGTDFSNLYVDGVSNGTGYFVRLAMVDQAGNILQYFPDQAGLPTTCTGTTADATNCPNYGVVPQQVLGMFNKDVNCFIASAAYGSSMEPKIQIFRDFRHRFLLRSEWGRRFVMSYYKYGPYAARYISDKPLLRAIARGCLWPVFGFSWCALNFGLLPTSVSVVIILLALKLGLGIAIRKHKLRV